MAFDGGDTMDGLECLVKKLNHIVETLCQDTEIWWDKYPLEVSVVAAILSARTKREIILNNMDKIHKLVEMVENGITNAQSYEDFLRPFGLYRLRRRTFANLAELTREYGGIKHFMKELNCEKLVEELLRIPGIGAKTARIIALIRGCNYFVVDVHILRILNSIGKECGVEFRDIYDAMKKLDGFFDYETNVRLHLCLIEMERGKRR